MTLPRLVQCLICYSDKKRNKVYSHSCNNIICSDCIFRNIFIYLRLSCPYCRVDYKKNEVSLLKTIYHKEFDKCDLVAIGEVMSSCESACEVLIKCINQYDMMKKMPNVMDDVTSFITSINIIIKTMPFPFIWAIVPDAMNIIILDKLFLPLFIRCSMNSEFFHLMGVDRFILYDRTYETGSTIPIYNIDQLLMANDDLKMNISELVNIQFKFHTYYYTHINSEIREKLEDIIIEQIENVDVNRSMYNISQRVITFELTS